MRSHYNIVLFDASYFLYRNQSVGRGLLTSHKLAGSFIQSVVKLIRESHVTFDVGFLAFDKAPYHRTNILKGKYKDTRDKFTEDDVRSIDIEISNSVGEQRDKLLKTKDHMVDCIHQYHVRLGAIDILKNLSDFGLTTLSYKGYEADDIARIIVDLYGDKYSILLVSIDSDWIGMVGDNVDYLRVRHKGIKDFYDSDSVKSYPDYIDMRDAGLEEMGLSWYLEILESMGVGHNDMRKCWNPDIEVTIGDIVANWDNLENLREEYKFDVDTFKRQVSTFSFKDFPDYGEIVSKITSLRYNLHSPTEFNSKFIYELCTGIPFKYYKKLYENIRNYSLLQLPW